MKLKWIKVSAAAALLAASLGANAKDAMVGDIHIGKPWARATAPTAQVGGGFMSLMNHGKAGDALIAAKANVSEKVELHTHSMEGGVMKMREVPRIDIPAGKTVELKPGSFHIMFINLKAPLKQGEKIPLTLVFEKAGEVKVDMQVDEMGAGGSKSEHKHH
ncbi:MAG: copper chaperone PCu(A)C [Burkholderiaceae bacterium]